MKRSAVDATAAGACVADYELVGSASMTSARGPAFQPRLVADGGFCCSCGPVVTSADMAKQWRLLIFTFLSALILYLRTLVPGVFVSDFAEFQYQPARLGLPHPNGFPFYMLLGRLWSHLPWGSVAWRMNLLSTLGGALAVAVTAGFARRLSKRISSGLLAAGLLALSPTFWFFSLAAERYTLNLALLVGSLWAAWESGQYLNRSAGSAHRQQLHSETSSVRSTANPSAAEVAGGWRLAWLSAWLLGLGLATHPSDMLLLPFWLGYLAWRLRSWRRWPYLWAGVGLGLGLPLLLYLYVPWRWLAFSRWPLLPGVQRSSAIYQGLVHVWYEPTLTWALLRHYVLGLGSYATGLLGGGWQEALQRLGQLGDPWLANVPLALLLVALIGGLSLWQRERALTLTTAGFAILLTVMVAYIQQGKNDAYLLPVFWVVYLWAGLAVDGLAVALRGLCGLLRGSRELVASRLAAFGSLTRRTTQVSSMPADAGWSALVLGLLLVLLWQRYPALDHSRWTDTRDWWESVLAHPLEPGAGLLGHWSDLTPLWYLQQIEGQRPDLVGLFPPDRQQVIDPWLEAGRPLYLAAPLHGWAPDLAQRYHLVPWGRLVRILPAGQRLDCPAQPRVLSTPESWPLTITSWDMEFEITPGKLATLRLCWQARERLPRNTFVTLRFQPLVEGQELAVNEPLIVGWYPEAWLPANSSGLAVIPVRLPLGSPPGSYRVALVPYRMSDQGTAEPWPQVTALALGEVTVRASPAFERSLLKDETASPVPWRAGPLSLRGWRVSSLEVRPGDPVQLDLIWQVQQPFEQPATLWVNLRDAWGRMVGPPQAFPLPRAAGSVSPGSVLRSVHIVTAPRRPGDHSYWLEPRLQVNGRWLNWWPVGRLIVGRVRVVDRVHQFVAPADMVRAQAAFGDLAQLLGYKLEPATPARGRPWTVTLYWRAATITDQSFHVFVHLVDEQGHIVAQHDGVPANGTLPTNLWVPQEIITDAHTLSVPTGLPAGRYTLWVGLYDPTSLARLPISSELLVRDRALQLTAVVVSANGS